MLVVQWLGSGLMGETVNTAGEAKTLLTPTIMPLDDQVTLQGAVPVRAAAAAVVWPLQILVVPVTEEVGRGNNVSETCRRLGLAI